MFDCLFKEEEVKCPECRGTGTTQYGSYCSLCFGKGTVTLRKALNFMIGKYPK